MKKAFREYYPLSEEEYKKLWDSCLFIVDANVLLNLYRYSQNTRNEIFPIFDKLTNRLWIPYQAALEYNKQRITVIDKQTRSYSEIREILTKHQNELHSKLNQYKKHPYIDVTGWLNKSENTYKNYFKEIDEMEKKHPDIFVNDPIRDKITNLFEGKIGKPYPEKRLIEIFNEGKSRFEKNIPPGFEDKKKEGDKQFSDLVLWYQIIDEAIRSKKSIVFVTDDKKEDWWLKVNNRIIGPRPELLKEIGEKANVKFYMYQFDNFIEHSQQYLGIKKEQQAIDEIRAVRKNIEEMKIINLYEDVSAFGSIVGKVYDKNKNGVPAATVKLWSAEKEGEKYSLKNLYPSPENPQMTVSRPEIAEIGTYIYYRLIPGSYVISAEKMDAIGNNHVGFTSIELKQGTNRADIIIPDLVIAVPVQLVDLTNIKNNKP
jgi:hypothetical protein